MHAHTTRHAIEVPPASPARAEASIGASVLLASAELANPPALSPLLGLRLERAGVNMWRAVDSVGRVIGHVQPVVAPEGHRYRARRYKPASGRFLDLGDFWSPDEAAWCLHYSA